MTVFVVTPASVEYRITSAHVKRLPYTSGSLLVLFQYELHTIFKVFTEDDEED